MAAPLLPAGRGRLANPAQFSVRGVLSFRCEFRSVLIEYKQRLEAAAPSALAYLDFPPEHRRWIRTNNIQERTDAEIKRRARVVQVFPSVESLVRLVGAVCCDQDDAWAAATNFMDRRSLARGYEPAARPPATRGGGDEERVLALVGAAFDRKRRAA